MSRLSHLVNLEPPPDDPTRPRGPMSDKRRWQMHRTNARQRGIEFKLTFEEWFCWWMDTGHYCDRGREVGKYVMGRKGDKGAYELGNIECIPANENCKAPHVGKPKSEEWKAKVRKTKAETRLTKRPTRNQESVK